MLLVASCLVRWRWANYVSGQRCYRVCTSRGRRRRKWVVPNVRDEEMLVDKRPALTDAVKQVPPRQARPLAPTLSHAKGPADRVLCELGHSR